jgi:hypothetical protein
MGELIAKGMATPNNNQAMNLLVDNTAKSTASTSSMVFFP